MTEPHLTADDIEIDISNYHEKVSLTIFGKLKDEESVKALKKEILEWQEFYKIWGGQKIDLPTYKTLTEKAEKWDIKQKMDKETLSIFPTEIDYRYSIEKLEAQVKELQEKYIELEIKYGIQKIVFDGCKQSEQKLEAQVKELQEELTGFKHGHSNLLKICEEQEKIVQKVKRFSLKPFGIIMERQNELKEIIGEKK